MIEHLADSYIGALMFEQGFERISTYLLIIVGAIVYAIVGRPAAPIQRAPYFAFVAAIFFAGIASGMIWLAAWDAVVADCVWVLASADVAFKLILGFLIARLAAARSRDGFGHGRNAYLAFIPLANFVLLFKASMTKVSSTTNSRYTSAGVIGVGAATLVAAAYMSVQLQDSIAKIVPPDSPAAKQKMLNFIIQAQGLEATLRLMAAEARSSLPMKVDEISSMTKIAAVKNELQRTITANLQSFDISNDLADRIDVVTCSDPSLQILLKAGAVIVQIYSATDGRTLSSHRVSYSQCKA